jgi:ABC-type Fe3+-hydroxamate transport system substrate-binding protein
VCLVPSLTELLHHLGLEAEVLGITRFCVHPDEWYRSKTRVGGTKDPRTDRILALQPDLIIASKEENVQSHIEALAAEVPVWLTDVSTVEDALRMLADIGWVTGRLTEAHALQAQVAAEWTEVKKICAPLRTAYFIWRKPYMLAGGGTYIHSVLQHTGLVNVAADQPRYPEVTVEQLKQLAPEVVFLSSEPYPFAQKHIDELQAHLLHSHIQLVDGEMFSWYGSRMLRVPAYIQKLAAGLRRAFPA